MNLKILGLKVRRFNIGNNIGGSFYIIMYAPWERRHPACMRAGEVIHNLGLNGYRISITRVAGAAYAVICGSPSYGH